MTEEQREIVAKAIYQAYVRWHTRKQNIAFTSWENLTERARDMYRFAAESAIAAYKRG